MTSVQAGDDGNVSVTFDGIKVILGTGILTIPVDLRRVDLTSDSIIIRDLPVIGSYTVKLSDSAPKLKSYTCN